jgi:hypothetical protein
MRGPEEGNDDEICGECFGGSLNCVVSSGVLVRLPSISVFLLLRTNIQSIAYSGSKSIASRLHLTLELSSTSFTALI